MEREARRSRIADIIANGPQSPTGELTELDKDAAKLYLDGLGAGSIAKIQKRDKKVVRDSLLKAGVYAPKPEFIRIAGVGESSRIVADLKRKEQRKVAASIIRLMRKGVKAETAAKQLGARIPSALIQSKWYKKLAQKRKSGKWVRMSSTFRVSAKYKDEYAFQDAIQEALKAFNIRHTRECTEPSGGRYDFDVLGWIVECKIDMRTKVAATAIGQCARYLAQRPGRVCLLIPNDVAIHPNDFKILDSMRVQVLREKNVASFFLGSGTT